MSEAFSIYLHYPWCITKCPYCDFNSYGLDKFTQQEKEYVEALALEIEHYLSSANFCNLELKSIFFGGGTPSLMSARSVEFLLKTIERLSKTNIAKLEITLEANPGSISEPVSAEKLKEFNDSGINRISLGAQSFSENKLTQLGRVHLPNDIFKSVENITLAGFNNFNLDLIFGCKGEKFEDWMLDLNQAINLNPKHISAYSLTIEPGTEFGRKARKGFKLTTSEEEMNQMYLEASEKLAKHGFERYEISNYAKVGCECTHNQLYWSGDSYLGVGAGAHSFLSSELPSHRWWNIPGPEDYMKRVQEKGIAISSSEEIDLDKSKLEFLFLKLRTAQGFSSDQLLSVFDNTEIEKIKSLKENLVSEGLMQNSKDFFQISPSGFSIADSIIESFAESL